MALLAFAVPVRDGMKDRLADVSRELAERRRGEYLASCRRRGVTREQVFLQQTEIGDIAIIVQESDNPRAGLESLSRSEDDFDVWLRTRIEEVLVGIDFGQPRVGPVWLAFDGISGVALPGGS